MGCKMKIYSFLVGLMRFFAFSEYLPLSLSVLCLHHSFSSSLSAAKFPPLSFSDISTTLLLAGLVPNYLRKDSSFSAA